jgi:delta 1-pyrroline-5-carboxylate dehydrogenase
MRIIVGCKRGNIADRDKWGHCLCIDCKTHRKVISGRNPNRKEYLKKWQKANSEKTTQYTAKWVKRNPAKRKALVESWRKRNPEKVKEINKKSGKKWAANNKGARNAITRKRVAALLWRTPPFADYEQIKLIYLEAARLTKETGIPHEVDHIVPLQGELVSGLHVHTNLQILTRFENRSKNNRTENVCAS